MFYAQVYRLRLQEYSSYTTATFDIEMTSCLSRRVMLHVTPLGAISKVLFRWLSY
jgi:hypothetical protein